MTILDVRTFVSGDEWAVLIIEGIADDFVLVTSDGDARSYTPATLAQLLHDWSCEPSIYVDKPDTYSVHHDALDAVYDIQAAASLRAALLHAGDLRAALVDLLDTVERGDEHEILNRTARARLALEATT